MEENLWELQVVVVMVVVKGLWQLQLCKSNFSGPQLSNVITELKQGLSKH